MRPKIETGFFVMEDAVQVLKQKDIQSAKAYLRSRVQAFTDAHPNTKKENILKTEQMIDSAVSIKNLSISVAHFILAHPSEDLSLIK